MLIEVMVALGVLVILVSGIFMVVQTSLKTVLLIDTRASREDEVTNITDILRSNFRNLPSRTRLVAVPVTKGEVPEFLFVLRNAPGFLAWRSAPESEDMIVLLSLRRDTSDGRWRICLKRFEPASNFPQDEFAAKRVLNAAADIPWLELVADFQELSVRFFDGKAKKWEERWENPQLRPALIELTMLYEHAKDTRSATSSFWIPPVKGGTS